MSVQFSDSSCIPLAPKVSSASTAENIVIVIPASDNVKLYLTFVVRYTSVPFKNARGTDATSARLHITFSGYQSYYGATAIPYLICLNFGIVFYQLE
jgi:hypothetical protein